MNFIKRHWFNLLMALIIVLSMGLTLLVAFSPKEDKLDRGFIPCSKLLAENVTSCKGNFWCTIKAVIKNSACDTKIIFNGLKMWVHGEQSAPWSNYFFEPDLSHLKNPLNENAELFYQENPNYLQDFEDLKQEHKKLEESIQHDETEKK